VVVASATLRIPVLRHVILWLGGVDAHKAAVTRCLDQGESLAVAPGGIAEMFWGFPRPGCGPDEEYALLRGRKGFVRLALEHGLPLVMRDVDDVYRSYYENGPASYSIP
jgi:hypothetical protein